MEQGFSGEPGEWTGGCPLADHVLSSEAWLPQEAAHRLDGASCHWAAGEKMLLVGKSQHLGFECQARTRAGV